MFLTTYDELKEYLDNKNIQETYLLYYDRQCLNEKRIEELCKIKPDLDKETIFYPIDDKHSWRIDDKREFARIMGNSCYVPKSYLCYSDFMKEVDNYPDDKIWFCKTRGGTSGRGVFAKYNKELKVCSEDPGINHIIQEEIENIDLWNKRKYVVRSYVLLWNKGAWFHKKALSFVHGKDYVPSTSHEIQVSHNGYASPSGSVKVHSLEKIGELGGSEKRADMYPYIQKLLYKVSKEICKKFPKMVESTTEKRYLILGIDYLVVKKSNNNYDLKIVEVNRYPNISHTSETNRCVNQRMIRDMTVLLYGINHPLGHDFIKLDL
tara:strand:- start:6055 stop:7017 length:963 start_codon:yes stop_codon:yes gene_type:complete